MVSFLIVEIWIDDTDVDDMKIDVSKIGDTI